MQTAAPVRLYRTIRGHFRTSDLTVTATARYRPPLPSGHRLTSLNECRLLAGPTATTDGGVVAHLAVLFYYTHCGRFGPVVHNRCRVPVDLFVQVCRTPPTGHLRLSPQSRLRGAELGPDGRELCAALLILATWALE